MEGLFTGSPAYIRVTRPPGVQNKIKIPTVTFGRVNYWRQGLGFFLGL